MVRKLQDVFPDELLGLPPHKESNLSIKVYSGIYLIPAASKELKAQLEELLSKG